MVTFDDILVDTIKMGTFQRKSLAVVSMIDFSDGIEKTIIGIMLTILAHQWNLQIDQVSFLASIYFIGIVSGTLFCALNADRIGRAKTLFYSSSIGFICILWMSVAQTYHEMIVLRLFFGFIFGTTIPLGHIVITEIVPANVRGSVMTIVATVFIVGKIYCTFLCMILLTDFTSGHWRILVALNSIPLLICSLGSLFILRESPRYYLSKQSYEDAFKEIEMISLINNRTKYQLTVEQKYGLMQTQQQLGSNRDVKLSMLFQGKYKGFTIRMWLVFILTSIIETSLYILMPFWLNHGSKGFTQVMYMMVSELIANLTVLRVIDSKVIGGRSRLVIVLALLIGLVSILVYLIGDQMLVIGMTLISFFLKMMFTTEMVIMNENYSTQYRSMGVGFTQTVGKLTGAIIPYVIFPIFYYDPYIPFLLYSVCMVLLAYITYQFPFDMTQVELDSLDVFGNQQQDTQVSDQLI